MLLKSGCHLTYCTNIHTGESWQDHQKQLALHLPAVKGLVAPHEKFGVGLRLSAMAAESLGNKELLDDFKAFLFEHNLYVFTLNAFPYGNFHESRVKDNVHQPDWQTQDRLNYTKNSFKILQDLVPEGLDGGISTSPLSYKPWFNTARKFDEAVEASLMNLVDVVAFLYQIREETGVHLHLDIEPEPDGILENTAEFILFYNEWLLKRGIPLLVKSLGLTPQKAEGAIRRHIQLCYDVCHFALVYEEPAESFSQFKKEGIGIGKIQLSAALSSKVGSDSPGGREALQEFAEDIYLHQVITKDPKNGLINSYRDLPEAFTDCPLAFEGEWRVHFHVPLFVEKYGHLTSTQQDVQKTLDLVIENDMKVHLEVETYTWDVLPDSLKLDINASIARELNWVKKNLRKKV